jgi:DeoR/GlpR family transcriptional regulator of sugar metabolism
VPIKRRAAANAKEVVVLADSRKFDSEKLVLFLRTDQVHTLITDAGIPDRYRREFQDQGMRIIIAETGGMA